jgi:hypothetical protein
VHTTTTATVLPLQVLADRMEFFNENPAADNFGKVRGQLAEVKDIMVENIGACAESDREGREAVKIEARACVS